MAGLALSWAIKKYCDPDNDICFIFPYIDHGYGMETRYHTLSCCSLFSQCIQWEQFQKNYGIQNKAKNTRILSQETNYSADRNISIDNICIGFVDVEYNGK